VDDKISYLLSGSNGVRYLEHHNYPSWKGGEDFLVLNQYDDVTMKAGDELQKFIIVYLPNFGIEKAKAKYETFFVSRDDSSDAIILRDRLIYTSSLNSAASLAASFDWKGGEIPLFTGEISFRDGVYTWRKTVPAGGCGYLEAIKTVPCGKNFDAVVLSDGTVLIRYEGESDYQML